ncbi:MAG: DUF308 domain-containing protein [Nitrososphaerota archaeon]|jgi:drug/metabolite transporter (DMT)-like permease|nr:DUF308 domain-containing protein [Nitrososphaerota archaeon]
MSWLSWASVLFIILGSCLFLYGANVYNTTVGWAGFCLVIVGILLFVTTFVYDQLKQKDLDPILF